MKSCVKQLGGCLVVRVDGVVTYRVLRWYQAPRPSNTRDAQDKTQSIRCICYNILIHIFTWNPNGAPCFDWSLGLVLGGWPSKIEVIWVPGISIIHIIHTCTETQPSLVVYIFVFKLLFQVTHQFSVHFDQQNNKTKSILRIPWFHKTPPVLEGTFETVWENTFWSLSCLYFNLAPERDHVRKTCHLPTTIFPERPVNLQGWFRHRSEKFIELTMVIPLKVSVPGIHVPKSRGSMMDHPGTKAFTNLSWVILGKDFIPFLLLREKNPAAVEVDSLTYYLQSFIHPRWCSFSSMTTVVVVSTSWSEVVSEAQLPAEWFWAHYPSWILRSFEDVPNDKAKKAKTDRRGVRRQEGKGI